MSNKAKKETKKRKLLMQIIPPLMVAVFATVIICGIITIVLSVRLITKTNRSSAISAAGYIEDSLEGYEYLDDMFLYWEENIDNMDLTLDSGRAEREKTNEFFSALTGSDSTESYEMASFDYEELDESTLKLYHELIFMEIELLFDSVKKNYHPEYIYLVVQPEGFEENDVQIMFAGKTNDEVRGYEPSDIYMPGIKMTLNRHDYSKLFKALNTGTVQEKREISFGISGVEQGRYHYFIPITYNGEILGAIGVCYSFRDVLSTIGKGLIFGELCMIAIFTICTFFIIHVVKKKAIEPIKQIESALTIFGEDMDSDRLSENLSKINTKNELGRLSTYLSGLGVALVNYLNNATEMAAREQKIESELSLAKRIQSGALSRDFDSLPAEWKLELHAFMQPAKEVGGDFYSFVKIDDDHLALAVADVSGKGVPASLFMMISKVLLENDIFYSDNPALILSSVNDKLLKSNAADMFVTVWLGILEISTGILKTANAGHEYPVIKRKDGRTEVIKDKHGLVMGSMEGLKYYEEEIKLERGDAIIVYTDGVPEATDPDDAMYGMDRLTACVERCSFETPNDCIEEIRDDIKEFIKGAEQFDDITLMVLKY